MPTSFPRETRSREGPCKATTGRASDVANGVRPAQLQRWVGFLDLRRQNFLQANEFLYLRDDEDQ